MQFCARCNSFGSIKPFCGRFLLVCECPPPVTFMSNNTSGIARAQSEDARKKGE